MLHKKGQSSGFRYVVTLLAALILSAVGMIAASLSATATDTSTPTSTATQQDEAYRVGAPILDCQRQTVTFPVTVDPGATAFLDFLVYDATGSLVLGSGFQQSDVSFTYTVGLTGPGDYTYKVLIDTDNKVLASGSFVLTSCPTPTETTTTPPPTTTTSVPPPTSSTPPPTTSTPTETTTTPPPTTSVPPPTSSTSEPTAPTSPSAGPVVTQTTKPKPPPTTMTKPAVSHRGIGAKTEADEVPSSAPAPAAPIGVMVLILVAVAGICFAKARAMAKG